MILSAPNRGDLSRINLGEVTILSAPSTAGGFARANELYGHSSVHALAMRDSAEDEKTAAESAMPSGPHSVRNKSASPPTVSLETPESAGPDAVLT
jgi:hypothetical protein